MTEWTDTPAFDVAVVATEAKPEKSLVQRYRRQFTALGVILMALALLLTDRQLYGTSVGLLLYWPGALAISAAGLGRFWCYVYNSGKRDQAVITETGDIRSRFSLSGTCPARRIWSIQPDLGWMLRTGF